MLYGRDGQVAIEQVLPIGCLQCQVAAVVPDPWVTPLFHINICGTSWDGDNVIVAITMIETEKPVRVGGFPAWKLKWIPQAKQTKQTKTTSK